MAAGYHNGVGPRYLPRRGLDLPPPPPETRREWLRRWWRSQGRHKGLDHWLLYRGTPMALVGIALFVVNGSVNGWDVAYDTMIGIDSPSATRSPLLAWPLSVVGWILVPSLVGAVAGYVVAQSIASRRRLPLDRAFADQDEG